jgi:outer membrane lipoprotein SlyB
MRKSIFLAGIAVVTMIPSIASAQQCRERQRSNRVVGTVGGAAVGGVAGNVVAGRNDKTL